MKIKRISLYIDTGNLFFFFFFDNKNSGNVFLHQNKIRAKNSRKMKMTFPADFESYVCEYLIAIKCTNGNKYDIFPNGNL